MSPDQPAVVDTTRTAQTVATATTAATPTGGQCADLISHCSEYGKTDCGTYSDFMSHYCPRYCGNCTPDSGVETTSEQTELSTTSSTECGDRLQNCTHYLEEYCCGIYEPWAKHNCASYCGFCGVPPPRKCTDSIEYCDREPDDLCTNPNYRLFRMENCAGFCKLCDTTVTVPEITSSN
ncbi:hypothetical protein C0Q70_09892 [Pomacea canaliculata]|uniref:ShKT domain-containing protein n=1 Tax=Pomacea canaliculata TaxID=400727 RepID=A0A2T7PB29_POMCA|nr:hypothetical protein C0Q70_09892 [Pomacea canaliculata]